jgi:hypothetical protein
MRPVIYRMSFRLALIILAKAGGSMRAFIKLTSIISARANLY